MELQSEATKVKSIRMNNIINSEDQQLLAQYLPQSGISHEQEKILMFHESIESKNDKMLNCAKKFNIFPPNFPEILPTW